MEKSSIYLQLKNETGDRLTVAGSALLLPDLAEVYYRLWQAGVQAEEGVRTIKAAQARPKPDKAGRTSLKQEG